VYRRVADGHDAVVAYVFIFASLLPNSAVGGMEEQEGADYLENISQYKLKQIF
jgi:hypothetical protein